MRLFAVLCFGWTFTGPMVSAQQYSAPAGTRAAMRRPRAPSILPGGRILAPLGQQYVTGPGPFGMAISPNGKTLVTANGGPDRYSLSVLERQKNGEWVVRHLVMGRGKEDEWRSVFMGLAFSSDKAVYASDGNSGRVRLVDLNSGTARRVYDLNSGAFHDSYSGDLAFDAARGLLYVVDQANFRVVIIDTKAHRILASAKLGRLPFAVALDAAANKLYVTNLGMFEYSAIPGADRKRARETGLPFPAFGFPSAEARDGARRQTAAGEVDVPGLGDPNVAMSNSVCVVDVSKPEEPLVEAFIRTGKPVGPSVGGSSPAGILIARGLVYVSNANQDSISVIDPKKNAVTAEIPLRIPGLEAYRGVMPVGMAWHEGSGWLLVAEAGINAVGVIDAAKQQVIGHLPVAWFPSRVLVRGDEVIVSNVRGTGVGPNVRVPFDLPDADTFAGTLRRGSVSVFPLPAAPDLPKHSGLVLEAAGLLPRPSTPGTLAALPQGIRYVVLIVKENRTFDEVLGDIDQVSNGPVLAAGALARFGRRGYADGKRQRFSIQDVSVTPNHHKIALNWSFSDNFYADSDVSVDGHHWLAGSYPNVWTQSSLMAAYGGQKDFRLGSAPGRLLFAESNSSVHPEELLEAGTLWHHLERNGISFRNYGEGFELAGVDEGPGLLPTGARFLTNVPMPDPLYRNTSREYPNFNMNIPDQFRATQFIREMETRYVAGGQELPRFIYIHLPNDHMSKPRPADGYPYEASFVADNDYALGRILEFLSGTKWWSQMVVFITEDDAQGGRDHVDAHRTVLMAAGPHIRRNYVSHVNSGFPGLLKTIFRLLGMPPLNLFDAAASDLVDLFTSEANPEKYKMVPVDARIFDPARARDPLQPTETPRMDDPAFLRQQHR